jgi:hypothetical protein
VSNGAEQRDAAASTIEDAGRLLRVTGMVRELRAEITRIPLDQGGRERLAESHKKILRELKDFVSDDLRAEIESSSIPMDGAPSESEMRLAQAQLAGWLEGVLAGINATARGHHMQALAEQARAEQQRADEQDRQERPGKYL